MTRERSRDTREHALGSSLARGQGTTERALLTSRGSQPFVATTTRRHRTAWPVDVRTVTDGPQLEAALSSQVSTAKLVTAQCSTKVASGCAARANAHTICRGTSACESRATSVFCDANNSHTTTPLKSNLCGPEAARVLVQVAALEGSRSGPERCFHVHGLRSRHQRLIVVLFLDQAHAAALHETSVHAVVDAEPTQLCDRVHLAPQNEASRFRATRREEKNAGWCFLTPNHVKKLAYLERFVCTGPHDAAVAPGRASAHLAGV